MLALYFSSKCFAIDFSNLTLKIHIDNTAVVSVLQSMGTSHNELLQKKWKLIWEWCKSKNIWLFPVYVNTKHNLADEPSRKIYNQREWMVARTIFFKALRFNITLKTKGLPINSTSQHRKPCSSEWLEKFVGKSSKDRVDGLSCVRERFLIEGLSNESTNIIMESWWKSTSIKYQVYINQWLDFCKNHNINYQNASVSNGLDFLTSLYQSGKQYPTISRARSILSLFIHSSNGLEFGKESLVQRFMKGIYQLRPSLYQSITLRRM